MDWVLDKAKRGEPVILTRFFHAAIPVLKYLDWSVVDTDRGYAKTLLPINVPSSNQHITHQAAVMMIAADYTGGIALGTLLHGVPLVGVHPLETDYGAYLWGAKAEVKWIRPSTDDLQITATIKPSRRDIVVRRFFEGRRVLEPVHIELFNDDGPVAEATFVYWVQDTHALRRDAFDERKVHLLYDHKRKTSAKLIAGVRAMEQSLPEAERQFNDPLAARIAGRHGKILAERFSILAPQLRPMVAARTRNADELAKRLTSNGALQIVNVGAGFDIRAHRVALTANTKVFNLDLPIMLKHRRNDLGKLDSVASGTHFEVPIDLRESDLSNVMLAHPEFDHSIPTLVIWEGGSMYFERELVSRILRGCRSLLHNPASRFWFDFVTDGTLTSVHPVVADFMSAMRALGEPFIHEFSDLAPVLMEAGLVAVANTPSSEYNQSDDPIFSLYRFCEARAG